MELENIFMNIISGITHNNSDYYVFLALHFNIHP